MCGYPKWFPALVYGVLILLVATGCLLEPTALFSRFEYDVPWRLRGSVRLPVVAAHAAASALCLMAFGALWHAHIPAGFRKSRNRVSGLFLCATLVLLTVSGIGVLYFGDPFTAKGASVVHTGAGALVPLFFIAHVLNARKIAAGARRACTLDPIKANADVD